MKNFTLALIIGIISINACTEEKLETRVLNGIEYEFKGNKITEKGNQPEEVSYGVLSDIHGEHERAKWFAEEFKKQGVKGIIITGDTPLNEQLRYGRKDNKEDRQEIIDVLSSVASAGLPVYVIPGNHETKNDYEDALKQITKTNGNIIDMTRFRVFDGKGVDFVSLPGYQTMTSGNARFIPQGGYHATPEKIREVGDLRKGLDDAVLLITHGAGKTSGKPGPATIYDGTDVGDMNTTSMQQEYNISFAVVGHIHEAGGIAADFNGKNIRENEWSAQFTLNSGSLESWKHINGSTHQGMGAIITFRGSEAMYRIIMR